MIQIENASVSLRDHCVFQHINVCLESGISYLVEGKNGVGKTTLLKLISGRIMPAKGSVRYDFIDGALEWEAQYQLRKKYLHFAPSRALHELIGIPDLFYQQRYYSIENNPLPTVRDYLGERIHNLAKIPLPESFQLHHLLDLHLTLLSNGQVKKIIILKQLLDTIPKVLFLDYPFEGLDASSRMELSNFLDHLTTYHHIQLILADNEHPHLPHALTKRILVQETGISITDRSAGQSRARAIEKNVSKLELWKTETAPVVEMRDVKIKYGDKVIIDKLNWTIRKGERWALTGRNGSGKTTLFSMIYADHPMAYSEQVFLFGKRRGSGESIWYIKKRISYLGPEQLHFLDYATEQLTVLEYLEKGNTPSEKIDQMIARFQIEHLLPKRLRQLSNGQLQLTLLIALFLAPKELLLLDEPFQYLDPQQKMNVAEYLDSCLAPSTTLVLITHLEDDVNRWGNCRLSL